MFALLNRAEFKMIVENNKYHDVYMQDIQNNP